MVGRDTALHYGGLPFISTGTVNLPHMHAYQQQ
jgi:hypothetical protein